MLISEVWEENTNKIHSNALERAFELEGIKFVTTARKDRRGGGVAIALDTSSEYSLTKLNVGGSDVNGNLWEFFVLHTILFLPYLSVSFIF